ncbi:inhibitor of nuclear factor kappa-B kinase subunit epsilon isoform X3 [Coregonus clupeaformis]|uniref:inhibitor of nuclear factor kappa-B kinase subunit epsilon isoform X3 n=1 Tax=Coregonus clupeaformis TaxID=59861 RepID=UPI001BE03C11|nr:inhibitor of nuclear factor kappa-B kinase subunit epsilon isoform X3 [Coregonus clupeaformis]
MTEKMTASTANYLWSLGDVLGQGATASVYKARNKRTGEQVAVKVFNQLSYSRPYEVQMREFEMLRRLNHNNIVKLFSVEELNSKQKVLVMEYCSGGSLLSLLEEPENAFGLPETEFLIVLQCVVQGMNHLRENGVVHRDIKPGNIMRQVGEDGSSVYKLTDFGAARELEDDEKFVSIYGTEEYLHPDMYERAVLRKPQHKAYGVSVDLWSIGVTFYHAATGTLPFTPYGGPRRNKPTMYKITKEKPVGAIAGVQRVNDGPIEWSYHLPHSCLLSKAAIFCEEVASQTGVGLEKQHFLFLGHDLSLEGSMKVVNFPPTSPSQPLLLLSRTPETHAGLPYREPEMPNIPSRFDVVSDYSFSKLIVGVVHQYLRIVRSLHTHRELFIHGYYSYIEKVRRECGDALLSISMVNMRLQSCLSSEHRLHTLGQFPLEAPDSTDDSKKLRLIRENLPVYAGGIREFQTRLEHLHIELAKHSESLAEDKSIQKMEVLLEKIMAIHQQYRKDRLTGKLAYNDEQIHKFEKIHLSSHIKRVKGLFREECLQKYRDLLASASTWSSVLREMQCRLSDFGNFSRGLMGDLEMCEERQNKFLDRVLLRAQPGPGGQEATPREKEHMVLRCVCVCVLCAWLHVRVNPCVLSLCVQDAPTKGRDGDSGERVTIQQQRH